MKPKHLIILMTLGWFTQSGKAQYIMHQFTYASTSASYQGSTMMLDYTIGELAAVSTIRDSSFIITQGLHQPDKYFVGINEYEKSNLKGYVFPNPFTGNLNLHLETLQTERYQISVFDAVGKLVYLIPEMIFSNSNANYQINLENLAEGVYYLKVERQGKAKCLTFPLIKTRY